MTDMGSGDGTGGGQGTRLARHGAVAFLARSLQQIATFVLTLLAARFLVPAEYGVYTLAVVFITFIQTMTYTGYFHYIVTAKGDEKSILGTTFWLILGLATVSSALLALAAPMIARAYDAPDLKQVLWWLAFLQPLAGITAWYSAVLMRNGQIQTNFRIMIAQNTLALVGGVALLLLWQSIYALVAFRYLRVLSGNLLYALLSRSQPNFRLDPGMAQHASGFSAGLYGTRFLVFLSNYGADLILGLMFSTAEAGLYRFGNRLATSAIDIVRQPMQNFALTQFGAANRSDADFAPLLRRFSGSAVLLTGCVVGVILVFAEDVVRLFFKESYLPALVVTHALAIRALVGNGLSLVEPVMAAKGRTGVVMMNSLVWTIVQVVAVFTFARFGLDALAWAQAAVTLASSIGSISVISRAGGVRITPAIWANAQALGLVALYTLACALLFALVQAELGQTMTALAVGLVLAGIAALATLALGLRLHVLDLKAFSG